MQPLGGMLSSVTRLGATVPFRAGGGGAAQKWNEGQASSAIRISSTSLLSEVSAPEPVAPPPRSAIPAGPMTPCGPRPFRNGAPAPVAAATGLAVSVCVNTCDTSGMPEPAFAMSRMIESIAMRMFCWRSATSGSRRNALPPTVSRPKMAPETTSVITIATISSIMLKPRCPASGRGVSITVTSISRSDSRG